MRAHYLIRYISSINNIHEFFFLDYVMMYNVYQRKKRSDIDMIDMHHS